MDARKIVKFGSSSHVISLPNEWIKKNNLHKGDKLVLLESKEYLIMLPERKIQENYATITLETKIDKFFSKELMSYYLRNYKNITIEGKNIIEKLEEIKILLRRLSSIEIVELEKNRIVLKDMADCANLNTTSLIREIMEMIKVIFKEIIKSKKGDRHHFIAEIDSSINKLSFLSYKSINYNLSSLHKPDELKNEIYFHRIVHSLEHIGDTLKRLARYLKDEETEKTHFINLTLESLEKYFLFICDLFHENINIEKNFRVYLDKKQSLLLEIEKLKGNMNKDINLYLLITQMCKDIIGQIDNIVLSILDLNT